MACTRSSSQCKHPHEGYIVRRCEERLAQGPQSAADAEYAQCRDLVVDGGITGQDGSCCKADTALYEGWCLKVRLRVQAFGLELHA